MRIFLRVLLVGLGLILLLSGAAIALARSEPATSSYRLAYASEHPNGQVDIYLGVPDGGSRTRLISDIGMLYRISFAPDGETFVFDAVLQSTDDEYSMFSRTNQVYSLLIKGGEPHRLTNDFREAYAPAWSPDGQWISFMADDGKQFYSGASPVTTYPGIGPIYDGYQVYLMRADGSEAKPLTTSHEFGRVYWSPDSQWIAYISTQRDNSEIYKMSIDGSQRQQLTFTPSFELSPSWSPNGRYIAFLSDQDNIPGNYNVFIMDSNGLNMRRLTDSLRFQGAPTWSPDGEWIAFVQRESGDIHHIYRIHPDGTGLERITPVNGESSWAPAWSRPFEMPWRGLPSLGAGIALIAFGMVIRLRPHAESAPSREGITRRWFKKRL